MTFEVLGNCGHSAAPLSHASQLKRLVLGPCGHLHADWTSFGQYLDRLDAEPLGIHVGALVGHGALRACVMDGATRPAQENETRLMGSLLDRSLEEGALGFSTGLEYAPGSAAESPEIEALCAATAAHGALYATHVRNRDRDYAAGIGEAIAAAQASGARTQISHIQPKYGAPPQAAAHMMQMVQAARDSGADVAFDLIPHTWGPTMVASVLPAWAFEGGLDVLIARLRDPTLRPRLKHNPRPLWQLVAEKRWDDIVLFECTSSRAAIGQTIAQIGKRRGVDPHDAVLDLLADEGEALYGATWVAHNFRDEDIRALLAPSHAGVISDSVTLAPTGPLANARWSPSTYGWTARFLADFARDLSLEDAVFRLTGLPAQRLGINDRGVLREGSAADLVVFDPQRIADRSTLESPNVSPDGIAHVFVAGCCALRDGRVTGTRAGGVVRSRSR